MQFDWCVGQILDCLDSLGLSDNTLIILSSDNGAVVDDGYEDQAELLQGEHSPTGGLRGFKYSAFEGGTRVPAIASWPKGIVNLGVSDKLLSQVDWLASFADLLGVKMPRGAAPDSRSMLVSWLNRKGATDREYVVQQAANKTLSIRAKRWKYIEPSDGAPMITWGPKIETGYLPKEQLYDLKNDPKECINVAEQHKRVVGRLRKKLAYERNK